MSNQYSQQRNVANFFSNFAGNWDSFYGGKRNVFMRFLDYWLRRDIWERYEVTFSKLGNDLAGKKILDIGCGSGIYCTEAAKRGADKVIGIDAARDMVAIASEKAVCAGYKDKCEFIQGSFPVGNNIEKVDLTIVMGVMDYIEKPLEFLIAVKELTKEFAVISFPAKNYFRAPLRQFRYKLLGRCAVYNYNINDINKLCSEVGFVKSDILTIKHSGGCHILTAYC